MKGMEAPGGVELPTKQFRKLLLYPSELRATLLTSFSLPILIACFRVGYLVAHTLSAYSGNLRHVVLKLRVIALRTSSALVFFFSAGRMVLVK